MNDGLVIVLIVAVLCAYRLVGLWLERRPVVTQRHVEQLGQLFTEIGSLRAQLDRMERDR